MRVDAHFEMDDLDDQTILHKIKKELPTLISSLYKAQDSKFTFGCTDDFYPFGGFEFKVVVAKTCDWTGGKKILMIRVKS